MGRAKDQGTRLETLIVRKAREWGLTSNRLPLTSTKHEPDVEIGDVNDVTPIPVLIWKRLTASKGGKRRSPDGTPIVAVLSMEDFLELYYLASRTTETPEIPRLLVQAKATQTLNVTRVHGDLVKTLQENPF